MLPESCTRYSSDTISPRPLYMRTTNFRAGSLPALTGHVAESKICSVIYKPFPPGCCPRLPSGYSIFRGYQKKGGNDWSKEGNKPGIASCAWMVGYSEVCPLNLSRNASASSGILKVPRTRLPCRSKNSRHWETCSQKGDPSAPTTEP